MKTAKEINKGSRCFNCSNMANCINCCSIKDEECDKYMPYFRSNTNIAKEILGIKANDVLRMSPEKIAEKVRAKGYGCIVEQKTNAKYIVYDLEMEREQNARDSEYLRFLLEASND